MMQRGGDEFDCSKNVEIEGVNESEMGLDVFRGNDRSIFIKAVSSKCNYGLKKGGGIIIIQRRKA